MYECIKVMELDEITLKMGINKRKEMLQTKS